MTQATREELERIGTLITGSKIAILTTENEEQAWARARPSEGDKGGGAARACLDMIQLRTKLSGARR